MENLNLNMIIYPVVALVSIFGIFSNKEKKVYKYLAVILLILSMIRFDTGYDYFMYYSVAGYEDINHPIVQIIYKDLEIGIKTIVDISRYYKQPQYFFAITGFITFGLMYYTIYRDSKSPLISLSFFMFLEMGFYRGNEIVMQYCALAICFFSVKYAYEKKYIYYLFLVLFASILFHKSAILCIVFIFIPRLKIRNYIWLIYCIFSFIFFEKLLPFLAQIIVPQYVYLFTFEQSNIYGFKDIVMSLILVLFILFLDIKKKLPYFKLEKQTGYMVYQKNIFLFGSILTFALTYAYRGHAPFRIGVYFMIYYLVLIGNYSSYISFKIKKIVKVFIILVLNLWIIRGIIIRDDIILNKPKNYTKEGEIVLRPNSAGFKLFFKKTKEDITPFIE